MPLLESVAICMLLHCGGTGDTHEHSHCCGRTNIGPECVDDPQGT